jgi:hypothetical protein
VNFEYIFEYHVRKNLGHQSVEDRLRVGLTVEFSNAGGHHVAQEVVVDIPVDGHLKGSFAEGVPREAIAKRIKNAVAPRGKGHVILGDVRAKDVFAVRALKVRHIPRHLHAELGKRLLKGRDDTSQGSGAHIIERCQEVIE